MSGTNEFIVGGPVLTIDDLSKAVENAVVVWKQIGSTLEEIAADLMRAWELVFGPVFYNAPDTVITAPTERPRSPKHPYTFPVRRKWRQIDICPVYQANLKSPRNLPYQRRNY